MDSIVYCVKILKSYAKDKVLSDAILCRRLVLNRRDVLFLKRLVKVLLFLGYRRPPKATEGRCPRSRKLSTLRYEERLFYVMLAGQQHCDIAQCTQRAHNGY